MKKNTDQQNILPNVGKTNKIIFGCIVGSHAYGTNVEGSDVDKKWVYVQSAKDLFVNGYKPQIEISKDEVAFELTRFLELARKANPTILELLFSPEDCILYEHPLWKKVTEYKKEFLTKQCRFSFGGYAISQIEKAKGLDKKLNWEKERTVRKSVLDFCYWIAPVRAFEAERSPFRSIPLKSYHTPEQIKRMGLSSIPHTRDLYNLYSDIRYIGTFSGVVKDEETSNDINLSTIPKDALCIGMLYFNKDAYQVHCKEYREYREWLDKRNKQRYVDIENHQQQIDGKNLLHCVRLIETALDIAEHKELVVRRDNAQFLIDIRQGKVNLERIIEHAQKKIENMDILFKESTLPDEFESEGFIKLANYEIRAGLEAESRVTVNDEKFDDKLPF